MKLIIVGGAASGKDWFKQRLKEKGYSCGIAYTTRPARPGEADGVDYFFTNQNHFKQLIETKSFVEWTHFPRVDFYYGTTKTVWDNFNFFIMNPFSLSQLNSVQRKEALIIYLDMPLELRKKRLESRADVNDDINGRLAAHETEFKNFSNWDIRITKPEDFNFLNI